MSALGALTGLDKSSPAVQAKAPAIDTSSRAKIEKTAQDFEAFFLSQMYQQMYKDVPTDGVMGGGHGEEAFRSFMLDDFARLTAKTGRIGLGRQIADHMIRLQEARSS
jgi:flagellar protein FlgJ